MTKQNIQYVIKVLSGVNEGATADLRDASGLVIGRSAGCDIIFNGANVADRHVAIELDKGKVRLTPLAQPVYIDGRDVGSHEIVLQPNQLVNVGVVDFTIAEKNQPWPDYDAKTKKIATANAAARRKTDTRAQKYLKNDDGDVARDVTRVNEKSSILGNPWLWMAAVIMLLANVHYLTKQYGGIPGLLGVTETASQKISALIQVDKYPGLYVKRLSNGVTQVRGYVATKKERSLIENDVSKYKEKVALHVLVDSEIEDNARKIAQSLGENEITFSTIEHGRLKAIGITESRSKWLSVKENIRNDVQGLNSINDDEVRNLHEKFYTLVQQVAAEKFSKRLEVSLKDGTVTAKGKLTGEERKRWTQIKEDFLRGSFYPFRFRELIRTPDADIKLSIRSVSVGEIPFVVSKEGNKYFKGSHVGSGYYIESINDDHILLNNNNIVFPVYFGQEKE